MSWVRMGVLSIAIYSLILPGVASALTISPVKSEVTGDPGQRLVVDMELLNETAETKTYYASYENFEPADDSGSPKFIGGGSGLATWLSTESSLTLAPKERRVVQYEIAIPVDAEPGGYFAAIFWGEQPPGVDTNQVSVGGKLGILVLLRVDGDIPEGAGIADFDAAGGRWYDMLPISFSYRVNNIGADRIVPLGQITIKNTWGGVAGSLNANVTEGSVLPNSARRFEVTWEDALPVQEFFSSAMAQLRYPRIGFYRAELALAWGERNQSSVASYWFFIFPWQLLLILTVLGVGGFFSLKRYNRWIIDRSRRD